MTAPPAESQLEFLFGRDADLLQQDFQNNSTLDANVAMFLFEKNYDALQNPPQLRNFLNGTCQKGQLLLRGYVQELENGNMLRNTYMKRIGQEKGLMGDDLILFDLNDSIMPNNARPYEEPNLYYRSDDDQRTIMSGQVLLRGLFGDLIQQHSEELGTQMDPVIKVHTADRERDVLSPNPDVCPKLNDLWNEAVKSREYVERFVDSVESQELDRLMKMLSEEEEDVSFREQAQDCLMTTICNDRDLPPLLDDYGRDGDSSSSGISSSTHNDYFDRLQKYSFQPYNYVLRYNDAQYSKIAFGPMWVEILSNFLPFVPTFKWQTILPQMVKEIRTPAPLLSLFSAHDTTILPILATLGEKVWDGETWAPYASLIVLELHKIGDGDDRAFRLIYNGQVLTDKVEGCLKGKELCDVMFLFNRLKNVAVKERDCATKLPILKEYDFEKVILTREGVALLLTLVIVSGVVGGLSTFVYLTRRLPFQRMDGKGAFNKAPSSTLDMDDDEIEVSSPTYGYGAPDTSSKKDFILEENIIL